MFWANRQQAESSLKTDMHVLLTEISRKLSSLQPVSADTVSVLTTCKLLTVFVSCHYLGHQGNNCYHLLIWVFSTVCGLDSVRWITGNTANCGTAVRGKNYCPGLHCGYTYDTS